MRLSSISVFLLLSSGLAAAAPDSPMPFERRDLAPGPFEQVTEGLAAGDVDGDGVSDLVVGGDDYLVWYDDPGDEPQLIDRGFKFGAGSAVAVHDLDGDGRLDVVSGRYDAPDDRREVWYQNTPLGWRMHELSPIVYCHDVAFGDIDGDGRPDMACADDVRERVSWLRAPADPTAKWTVHDVDERNAVGAAIADIDRDGRLDLLSGRAWYRNDGGTPPGWTRVALTTLRNERDSYFDDHAKVSVLDLDDDGRLDVFATLFMHSREGQVWAFFQPPSPVSEPWPALQIDSGPLFGVHSQAVASFDGTDRPQVMVGETNVGGWDFGPNPDPQIYVYRRIGAARELAGWERLLVDRVGTHEAHAVDFDGDGLSDIAGHEENTDLLDPPRAGPVSWWRNVTEAPAPPTPPAGCSDPAQCPSADPCGDPSLSGAARGACVCWQATARCTSNPDDRGVARRIGRGCARLEAVVGAPTPDLRRTWARGAARRLTRALVRLESGADVVAPACDAALRPALDVARQRAEEAAQ